MTLQPSLSDASKWGRPRPIISWTFQPSHSWLFHHRLLFHSANIVVITSPGSSMISSFPLMASSSSMTSFVSGTSPLSTFLSWTSLAPNSSVASPLCGFAFLGLASSITSLASGAYSFSHSNFASSSSVVGFTPLAPAPVSPALSELYCGSSCQSSPHLPLLYFPNVALLHLSYS